MDQRRLVDKQMCGALEHRLHAIGIFDAVCLQAVRTLKHSSAAAATDRAAIFTSSAAARPAAAS